MNPMENLLPGPAPTLLPDDPGPRELLDAGADPEHLAAANPESTLVWAVLADQAYAAGSVVPSYAYARTGYHRGLDQLRRAGWKGHGPIPWEHQGNRGFLRALAALGRAAAAIGEEPEAARCAAMLQDSSPEAAQALHWPQR